MSYCIGFETAKRLKMQFAQIDLSYLEKGFLDGAHDATPKLDPKEIQSLLTSLQQQIEQQQKAQFSQMAEENKKESEAFLEKNKKTPDIRTLSSGLQYLILNAGDKTSPSPTMLDTVSMHYRGTLIDGKVFDSSHQRGEPLVIPLSKAIPGWTEILQLMHVGDKWKVFIPPYLAYGEMGFPPVIGPNATLIFEMELVEILK